MSYIGGCWALRCFSLCRTISRGVLTSVWLVVFSSGSNSELQSVYVLFLHFIIEFLFTPWHFIIGFLVTPSDRRICFHTLFSHLLCEGFVFVLFAQHHSDYFLILRRSHACTSSSLAHSAQDNGWLCHCKDPRLVSAAACSSSHSQSHSTLAESVSGHLVPQVS